MIGDVAFPFSKLEEIPIDPPVVSLPLRSGVRPLLFVVEGQHDIEFLRRLTVNLSRDDPAIPNLGAWEREGRLVFIPFGGGDVLAWSDRFAPLRCPEVHLYDRELPPKTANRLQAVSRVNSRPDCRAFLTTRRSLENYLHPTAIVLAGGLDVEFDSNTRVAERVARHHFESLDSHPPWEELSRRGRSRCLNRAKRWLNTVAVEYLSRELLESADPQGEVLRWLGTISMLMPHE